MKNSVIKNIVHSFWNSFQQLGDYRKCILLTSIMSLMLQAFGLFETYLFAEITDALYAGDKDTFLFCIGLALGLGLLAIILQRISAGIDLNVKLEAAIALKKKTMSILWDRKENVMKYSAGEQHNIIQEDCEQLVLYVYQVISYVFSFAVLIYISITLFFISPKWSAIFALMQILVGILQKKGAGLIKEKSQSCLRAENEVEKYLNEDISHMHAIRFEGIKSDVIDFLEKELEYLKGRQKDRNEWSIRLSVISRSIMYIGKIILFFGMGGEVLAHRVSMAQFIVFYSYMSMFTSNFMYVIQMITSLQPMLLNVNRLLGILAMEQEIYFRKQWKYDRIEWKHVDKVFGEKVLFSDVNLRINMKKSYALVGANGSGKTTFMKILFGEEKISAGKIFIDDAMQTDWKLEHFADIYYFAASPCVLSGLTIRENLLLGIKDKTVSDEDLKRICRDFLFWNDIEEMCNGWNTVVGSDVNLSSGQMKKVQLIRAALCEGTVVIIDEPVANLDEKFQKAFTEIFKQYFAQKKVIVVEHGRQRVGYVDEVLEIKNHGICF